MNADQLPALRLDKVSRSYGSGRNEVRVLEDISFEVVQHEFLCVLGESGCGKSTLLQLMAGFQRPTAGRIAFMGHPIEGPSPQRSVVFQGESLLPWLTVKKNISLGPELRGELQGCEGRLEDLIRLMGLEDFASYYPAEISGGMAQRVAIARALINDASLLLLDEPFSGLDTFTRMRLQSELLRIWRTSSRTVVFVTHDVEEAVFLGSRVVVMSARPGRVARVFNVSLSHPRDRASAEFVRLRGMITKEFRTVTEEEFST
jgi:NitT/TauT family transport system ATP-binding protein